MLVNFYEKQLPHDQMRQEKAALIFQLLELILLKTL
jgi:hypothetical protein